MGIATDADGPPGAGAGDGVAGDGELLPQPTVTISRDETAMRRNDDI
jgi:hypothetical protein